MVCFNAGFLKEMYKEKREKTEISKNLSSILIKTKERGDKLESII